MKRAATIILSLTLVWLQVMASAQSISIPPLSPCDCCTPENACCCVEQSDPKPTPIPAAPVFARASIDFAAVIPSLAAWTLPATALALVSSVDPSISAPVVPLFTRHCALLI